MFFFQIKQLKIYYIFYIKNIVNYLIFLKSLSIFLIIIRRNLLLQLSINTSHCSMESICDLELVESIVTTRNCTFTAFILSLYPFPPLSFYLWTHSHLQSVSTSLHAMTNPPRVPSHHLARVPTKKEQKLTFVQKKFWQLFCM